MNKIVITKDFIDYLTSYQNHTSQKGAKMIEAYWMKDEYPHTGDVICSNCKSRCDALREAHWGKNWKDLGTLGWKFHTYYQYCPHCGAKMIESQAESENKNGWV